MPINIFLYYWSQENPLENGCPDEATTSTESNGIQTSVKNGETIVVHRRVLYGPCTIMLVLIFFILLPMRASEQGNVIVLVSVYIYMSSKKIVIERTRDLIYLKFVATDFSPKIISPSAGENSGDSA